MSEKYVDLHLHTTASDGTLTPSQMVNKAVEFGFTAISVTDHDTTNGIAEAMQAGEHFNIEVVPGVELSAYHGDTEMHILGYYFNWHDGVLNKKLHEFRDTRRIRAVKIAEKLKTVGIELDLDEILKNKTEDQAISRAHIARLLIKQGYCKDFEEVFSRYLGEGCVAYVRKPKLTPKIAAEIIKECRGIPIVAHPSLSRLEPLLPQLIEDGIMGIEVFHSDHTDEQIQDLLKFAHENDILVTGGSDCHGSGKMRLLLGSVRLPFHYFEELKRALPTDSVKT